MSIVDKYIKYRLKAKNRHGIHSPFVYKLMDDVLNKQLRKSDKEKISELIKQLKNSNEEIDFQEFGAGSKKLNNKRAVSAILKNSSSKGKYGKLLYLLNDHFKFKSILEFGTSLGIGTTYFSLGNKNSEITTIEACPNTRELSLRNFNQLQLKNVESIHSTFNAYLDTSPTEVFDCIFIDGHHDGEALINYLERLKPNYNNETLIILDDIRWSDSMYEAWLSIIESENFNLSMDFFRFGIISPRKQQEKEHFILKY